MYLVFTGYIPVTGYVPVTYFVQGTYGDHARLTLYVLHMYPILT